MAWLALQMLLLSCRSPPLIIPGVKWRSPPSRQKDFRKGITEGVTKSHGPEPDRSPFSPSEELGMDNGREDSATFQVSSEVTIRGRKGGTETGCAQDPLSPVKERGNLMMLANGSMI
ncbi:hypothetical protein BO85DRAFT_473672 [Aspergillus piperis CBS 112811]|uniref:Uncharacterized protein n=1 Tax=Aspergillus piperis CBS 112811 TaxID=1448313 RepID=A0A8G1RDG4_9EURO|nr:hypothetical protein BO85DRAFT_473672 [Aspergillus piperis CBS 112811]RAH63042.1 hypothetical protein BO85DRAFT_473672 [Aspergillus piperis CBS 112811]